MVRPRCSQLLLMNLSKCVHHCPNSLLLLLPQNSSYSSNERENQSCLCAQLSVVDCLSVRCVCLIRTTLSAFVTHSPCLSQIHVSLSGAKIRAARLEDTHLSVRDPPEPIRSQPQKIPLPWRWPASSIGVTYRTTRCLLRLKTWILSSTNHHILHSQIDRQFSNHIIQI